LSIIFFGISPSKQTYITHRISGRVTSPFSKKDIILKKYLLLEVVLIKQKLHELEHPKAIIDH
jgi:hypothetical protein